jgi:hypothetical protein
MVTLDLRNNNIGGPGGVALAKAFERVPTLQTAWFGQWAKIQWGNKLGTVMFCLRVFMEEGSARGLRCLSLQCVDRSSYVDITLTPHVIIRGRVRGAAVAQEPLVPRPGPKCY